MLYSFHKKSVILNDKSIFCQQIYFKSIERGELCLCLEAKKPANNAKNRYTSMYPCTYIIRLYLHSYHALARCLLCLPIKWSIFNINLELICITLTIFIFIDDHSRVILKNSQDGNDYINANYIEASIID